MTGSAVWLIEHQKRPGSRRIFACREDLVGIDDVYEMVRNSPSPFERNFGRSDIEIAEDLERVAIDNFAIELLGDAQRKVAFTRACWPDDRYQWEIPHRFSVYRRAKHNLKSK